MRARNTQIGKVRFLRLFGLTLWGARTDYVFGVFGCSCTIRASGDGRGWRRRRARKRPHLCYLTGVRFTMAPLQLFGLFLGYVASSFS
jgi:hypothetical protein